MAKNNANFFKTKNEWSEIKDKLLGCYLVPYFQKILKTRRPIFYVDCFAGKGKFEDGKDGSPLIALSARDECLRLTTSQINKSIAIETNFIDLHYASELKTNIAAYNNDYGCPRVHPGRYEDLILELLKQKAGYNVFLYIDPYGIRALDMALFDKFCSDGFFTFEMLINFNSFGFFRDACRAMKVDYSKDEAISDLDDLVEYAPTIVDTSPQSVVLLSRIAGGDYWKNIVVDYNDGKLDGYQAEKRLSTEYKQRLKQSYKYVLDLPICLKAGHRPKYRMIHACNHEAGCFLMAQNMQKRQDEIYYNIQQRGQISFLELDSTYSQSVGGEWITKSEIAEKVSSCLQSVSRDIGITKFISAFVNDYGLLCDFNMIHEILDELQEKGLIQIIRNPNKTPTGKKTSFWEEKKEQTVTIRRCAL